MLLRILFIFILLIVGLSCAHKPYQPNYNTKTSHNSTVKARNRIIQRQANNEIRRSNLQRKRARKDRRVKRLNKKADKYSKKLIK